MTMTASFQNNLASPLLADPECDTFKFHSATIGKNVDPASKNVDCVAYMTTDSVDEDDEIVLPSGCDMSRFQKNRVLMLCHSLGQPGTYYPLPVGTVVDTKIRERGILAYIKFARSSAMGQEIKGLFDEDMLRSFSIGFRSVESSPLTRQEAETRPDWAAAFERTRGKILVHRRWRLIELSVAPIPCNEDALRVAYKSKGVAIPRWIVTQGGLNMDKCAKPHDDDEGASFVKPGMHVKCAGGGKGGCGIVEEIQTKCGRSGKGELDDESSEGRDVVKVRMHDSRCRWNGEHKSFAIDDLSPHEIEAKDLAEGSGATGGDVVEPEVKIGKPFVVGKAKPSQGEEAEDEDDEDKDLDEDDEDKDLDEDDEDLDDDEDDDEDLEDEDGEDLDDDDEDDDDDDDDDSDIKANDHVTIKAPHYKGFGVVKSVHRRGHVPDVEENIKASPGAPAARVACYKASGDGHVATGDHVGAKVAHLSKCSPLRAPSKGSASSGSKPRAGGKGWSPRAGIDDLPRLEAIDLDAEAREALGRLQAFLDPENLEAMLADYVDRKFGVI